MLLIEAKRSEAKSTTKIRPEHDKGLRAFQSKEKVVRRMMVYRGDHAGVNDEGIEMLPLGTFLQELEDGAIFPV